MLAILGHLITTAGNRLPGDIAYGVPFASVKSGLAAFDNIPAAGSLQLVCKLNTSLLQKHNINLYFVSTCLSISNRAVHFVSNTSSLSLASSFSSVPLNTASAECRRPLRRTAATTWTASDGQQRNSRQRQQWS